MRLSGCGGVGMHRMLGQAGSFARKEVTFELEQGDRGRGTKVKAF